jgi:Rap1a immunity proteins
MAPAMGQGFVYKSGNELLEALRQDSGLEHAYALSYIAGVVDTANGSATREGFCFDLGQRSLKASQLAEIVKPFLEKNPQMRERPGSVLVAAALAEAWPCK